MADTIFGIASGTKGFTAVATMALVDAGTLELSTTARAILGSDLPLIDDRVTVLDLLTHRSGIGDYVDEDVIESITDHVLPSPVHELDGTAAYLPVLDGHPQRHPPGERFVYNNSGFVVLALLLERVAGDRFENLVQRLVIEPAGLTDTHFHRMDTLPVRAATGYLHDDPEDLRTNALHLPVIGSGDGGLFSTAFDIHRFWDALLSGRLVQDSTVRRMVNAQDERADDGYGLGFWLPNDGTISLIGQDAGVSFVTEVVPELGSVWSVLCNTPGGAWPVAAAIREQQAGRQPPT